MQIIRKITQIIKEEVKDFNTRTLKLNEVEQKLARI